MQDLKNILPLLEAIISHIDDGILITDRSGTILYQNPSVDIFLTDDTNSSCKSIKNIRNISSVDLISIMKEAFYEASPLPLKKPSSTPGTPALLKKFHRTIRHKNKTRHLEIQCCLSCALDGQLRLFIIRDISHERRLTAFLERAAHDLVTNDPKMMEILQRIERIAPRSTAILLQGESGTGKTHIGRLIHRLSDRADQPLIEVNCAAIPESLLETVLFGPIEGTSGPKDKSRKGRFIAAHGGTLFLDELGEIPPHLQARLLRVLQDRRVDPDNSDSSVKIDVRIIGASSHNLRDMVDRGLFRADLYYRLAVIPLHIPPIRERPGDIPLLLKHFCDDITARGSAGDVQCDPEAMRMLMNYPWPGNVRELENAVEHAVICANDGLVCPQSLPADIRNYCQQSETIGNKITRYRRETEKQAGEISEALRKARGNKTIAAELLGINRSTLWRRMRRLAIE